MFVLVVVSSQVAKEYSSLAVIVIALLTLCLLPCRPSPKNDCCSFSVLIFFLFSKILVLTTGSHD